MEEPYRKLNGTDARVHCDMYLCIKVCSENIRSQNPELWPRFPKN